MNVICKRKRSMAPKTETYLGFHRSLRHGHQMDCPISKPYSAMCDTQAILYSLSTETASLTILKWQVPRGQQVNFD